MPRSPLTIPISVDAAWTSRFWTTDAPRYVPHTEWTRRISLSAERPLRVAVIQVDQPNPRIGQLRERGQDFSFDVGISTQLEPTLTELEDPWLSLGVERPVAPTTWTRIVVERGVATRCEVIAFPREDTDSLRNGRWRVRRDLQSNLDRDLGPLTIGAWSLGR